ncbi:MAG: SocA family protein [Brevundimonas sp.]|uniref:Panacea domain-containing protein n=1 Tax=Brevundimonas sp. TaxID=1871086 RepID=UPI0025C0977E|nr:Panacea domain-containing protein [Brevundimonas sp.]MBX3476685.1 SocA family protein [Brevundimonas sp.]
MTDHPSAAIANAFVDLADRPLPQMKLHKLTYMAHGWNLAITGERLVADAPEAWDNGPVFRKIWDRIRDYGFDRQGHILMTNGRPFKADLTPKERKVLEHVWNKYSKFSQYDLSDMTHQPGTPWTEAYFERGRNAKLSDKVIKEHYKQLALAGRAAS